LSTQKAQTFFFFLFIFGFLSTLLIPFLFSVAYAIGTVGAALDIPQIK